MKSYLSLAIKYLGKQKKTTIMTILSIIVGTFVICSTLIVIDTINRGRRDEAVFYGNYDIQFRVNNDDKVNRIVNHENINSYSKVKKDVYGYISKEDKMEYQHQESDSYEAAGYEFVVGLWTFENFEQDVFSFSIIEGNEPSKNNEIMIPIDVAELFSTKKMVGDSIKFEDREYTISGIYDAKWSSTKYTDNDFFYMYAVDSQYISLADDKYIDIYTKLKDHSNLINNAFAMGTSLELMAGEYFPNYEMAALVYYQSGTLIMIILILICAVLLITYVAMIIIRSNFSINVTERIKDYGILKGIGASNKQLCTIFMLESAIESIIGVLMGMVFAYFGMYKIFLNMINNGDINYFYSVKLSPIVILITMIVLMVTVLLAWIEPFGVMKKTQITEAINKNYVIKSEKNKIVKSGWLSFLGIEGEYAYKNARRNSKAFFTVVISFVIAIVVYIAFAGFTNSLFKHLLINNDEYFDATLEIENNKMTLAEGQKISEHLKKSKYFEDAQVMKTIVLPGCDTKILDKNGDAKAIAQLSIYNDKELELMKEHIIKGNEEYDKLCKEGIILVKTSNINLNVGDNIELITDKEFYSVATKDKNFSVLNMARDICESKGIEYESISEMVPIFEQEYEHKAFNIVAVADKSLYMDGDTEILQVIMSQEYFDSIVGKNVFNGYSNKLVVKTSSEADLQSINTFLLSLDDDAYVYFFNDEWESFQSIKSIKNKVNYFIMGMAAIGVFYIINSLASEQLRRKNEFAILKSIGMSKKQMIKMVLLEKGLMCVIAYIIGIIIGNILSYTWVTQLELVEENLAYIIPFKEMIFILLAMVVVTAISSIIPIITMKKSTQVNELY